MSPKRSVACMYANTTDDSVPEGIVQESSFLLWARRGRVRFINGVLQGRVYVCWRESRLLRFKRFKRERNFYGLHDDFRATTREDRIAGSSTQ